MPLDRLPNAIDLVRPAGCTDGKLYPQLGHADRVVGHDIGDREVDRRVNSGKILLGERHAPGVVELVQAQCDFESMSRRELLNELAHASVADQGQLGGSVAHQSCSESGGDAGKNVP